MSWIDIHPTETARNSKSVYRDVLHKAPNEPSETLFKACPHCGMANDTRTETPANLRGEGIKYVTVAVAVPSGTKNVVEPRRVSGCLLCGHNYLESTYRQKLFSDINLSGR